MIHVWYRGKKIGSVDVSFLGRGLHVPVALNHYKFTDRLFEWHITPKKEIGINLHYKKDVNLIRRLKNFAAL